MDHNPKEGFNKNSNSLSLNPLRVVESAAPKDCKKTPKGLSLRRFERRLAGFMPAATITAHDRKAEKTT
jgi:hypothetical protein